MFSDLAWAPERREWIQFHLVPSGPLSRTIYPRHKKLEGTQGEAETSVMV